MQAHRVAGRLGHAGIVLAAMAVRRLCGQPVFGPRRLRQTFERMGATYVKLGQFIASAPSIFPREYVAQFQNCLDQTTAIPFRRVRRVLRREWGPRLGDSAAGKDSGQDRVLLEMLSVGETHGLRFPRDVFLLMKQYLYFDRYLRIVSPRNVDVFSLGPLRRILFDQR